MSAETSDTAAIERQIRKMAAFSMLYGQPRPDPVNPLSPYRAPTEAEAGGLSDEIERWRALARQFVGAPAPLGTRKGPNLQNLPVRSGVPRIDQGRWRLSPPTTYGKPEPKPEGS